MKSLVVLLFVCWLSGALTRFRPGRTYRPYYNNYDNSYVNEDLIEYLAFTSCGQDGWVCTGEEPVEATLDCMQEGQSCENEISVALCNITQSLTSLTILNWKSVNISFRCVEGNPLDKLTIEDVGQVHLFGNRGSNNPYNYGWQSSDGYNEGSRLYPRHMTISGCNSLSFIAFDNSNTTGMEVLILKDTTIDFMRATMENLNFVKWFNVSLTGEAYTHSFTTRMRQDSSFLIEMCNLPSLPVDITTSKMIIRRNKLGEFGRWDASITADSFVLEDNEVCKVSHLNIQSNDILISNNDFKALLATAFSGLRTGNSSSDGSCDYDPQKRTLRILNNVFHYVQERAMELPQEGDLGEHFDITYDMNQVECSCRNINFLKYFSYENLHAISGRQIAANENFMGGNNMCSDLPCEFRNAVSSYRYLCGRPPYEGFSVCPPSYDGSAYNSSWNGGGSAYNSSWNGDGSAYNSSWNGDGSAYNSSWNGDGSAYNSSWNDSTPGYAAA